MGSTINVDVIDGALEAPFDTYPLVKSAGLTKHLATRDDDGLAPVTLCGVSHRSEVYPQDIDSRTALLCRKCARSARIAALPCRAAMAEKIVKGEAIDLAGKYDANHHAYVVNPFVEGKDYCDSAKDAWIWSIGRNKVSGIVLASTTNEFYQNEHYECLWLR